MEKYFYLTRIAFQEKIAYRANTFFLILKSILTLIVQIAVWKALYGSMGGTQSGVGTQSLAEMINYTIMANILFNFFQLGVSGRISDKVKTGSIAFELIRPMNFHLYMLFYTFGEIIFNTLFSLLPFLIYINVFYGVVKIPLSVLAPFIISCIFSFLVYYLISYLIGLCSFWFFEIWPFEKIFDILMKVFSGSWIPLWFFPKGLFIFAKMLPFQAMYYATLSIYLNKNGGLQAIRILSEQLIWIVILAVINWLVWRKCNKKLVVQGG